MIAITGANGHLGKLTLSLLLKKVAPTQLVAIVRDKERIADYLNTGIIIREANYEDPHSLNNAFEGITRVLQISTTAIGDVGTKQEQNVVKAAQLAGVQHIMYTSTLSPGSQAHFMAAKTCAHTEQLIMDSGISYTIFRNSMYMETIPLFIGNGLYDGQIYYPAENGKISFVSREDIAEALSNTLTESTITSHIYSITGEEAFTFDGIAKLLNQEKGLNSTYFNIKNEDYEKELAELHMPEAERAFYLSMADGIKANEFAQTDKSLERIIGKKRKSLIEYIQMP
ncbi:NmrA family NAD(P)-binding protein [Olivibacter domesticus]|uniref:NAD(P)H dehydrogenase (Quinone) n=1 Tax=Olivibacter domesticus TaxID=407022 RepID=A0A1H7M501_OLID1|nr:NAD(P)H-binding protein [Olivibacter domesticus]SEL06360.1 NAD(P)H dehydrogenase (quinone) [Olivibacter domesticus]